MLFSEYLERGLVFELESTNKDEALEEVVYKLLEKSGRNAEYDNVINIVRTREKDCNTQITEGVALPHARVEKGFDEIHCALGIFKNPVPWGNTSFKSVSLVIFAVTPKARSNEFIYLLSEIATLFEKTGVKSDLLKKIESSDVVRIVRNFEQLIV